MIGDKPIEGAEKIEILVTADLDIRPEDRKNLDQYVKALTRSLGNSLASLDKDEYIKNVDYESAYDTEGHYQLVRPDCHVVRKRVKIN